MFQKGSAALVLATGNKTYGILSVLCQAYYDLTYDFTVPPGVFNLSEGRRGDAYGAQDGRSGYRFQAVEARC